MLTTLCVNFLRKHYVQLSHKVSFTTVMKDIAVGDEVIVSRKITRNDLFNFAELSGDYNPIHFDSPNNLVHGAFLNSLVSGVLGTKLPGPGTIVVNQTLTFPKPCYVGDTVEIKVQIVSIRKIMECEYSCIANGERTVLKGNVKLIRKPLSIKT